jgi:hypothetical protein
MEGSDGVIDLMRARLLRSAESQSDDDSAEVAWTLLDMYDAGAVEARMEQGEVMFRLRAGYEGPFSESLSPPQPGPHDPPQGPP